MAEPEQPERTEEQLKALKRQVSGVPASLYTQAPKTPEAEAEAKAGTKAEGQSAETHHMPKKAATSKSRSFVRRSPSRKK